MKHRLPILSLLLVLTLPFNHHLAPPNFSLWFSNLKAEMVWLFESVQGKSELYPTTTVAGLPAGKVGEGGVESLLDDLEQKLEVKTVALTKNGQSWPTMLGNLGVKFNREETRSHLEEQLHKSFWQKFTFALTKKGQENGLKADLQMDQTLCTQALQNIPISYTPPQNAQIYLDGTVKVAESADGEQFDPSYACESVLEDLERGTPTPEIKTRLVAPDVPTAQAQALLPQVQTLISQPVSLNSNSKHWTVSAERIFSFLTFSPNTDKTALQIGWNDDTLNTLASELAVQTDTNNPAPALGNCEILNWAGGNRLDKENLKNVFKNLPSQSARSYTVKVDYFGPSIQKITPVSVSGSKGTIYLTYDDGMTYANQLMNYAACYGIKITFFAIGERAGTDAGPIQRAVASGHAVQSHGYQHLAGNYASGHSYDWQYEDIRKSIEAITSVSGIRPTYFRPPGGNKNADTYAAAAANGVTLVLWRTTSIDTVYTSPAKVCSNVLAGAMAGGTVLMHASKAVEPAAMPCIVTGLAKAGFGFAALR